jgi:hypothetical protein
VLSFNTASLPDGAVVTSVEVRLFYSQTSFGTAWTALGSLLGDVQGGCLGASCALAAGDREAAGLAQVNRTGTMQIRVRFSANRDADGMSDYLVFAGGGFTTAGYRPVLVVRYR